MKFRKKPVVIEAWNWDETDAMLDMLRKRGMRWASNTGHRDKPGWVGELRIKTLESGEKGSHLVSPGDWIIRGVKGEFYACKPDIFAMTYEDASTAAPEEHAGWNAAVRAAVKILRSNADGCSPGSTAEQQNWPFVLECMAREVEKLALPQSSEPR